MAAAATLTTDEYKKLCIQTKELARKWVEISYALNNAYIGIRDFVPEVGDDTQAQALGFPNKDGYSQWIEVLNQFVNSVMDAGVSSIVPNIRSISTAKPV